MKTRDDFGKLYELFNVKGVGAEIGVQKGINARKILENYTGKLICIDWWWKADDYSETKDRLAGLNIEIIKGKSMQSLDKVEDESLDFVYIDACHSLAEATEDIREWAKKVRKGGIVSGHDYRDGLVPWSDEPPFGVKTAVDDYCLKNDKQLMLTTDDYFRDIAFNSWWFFK